MRRRTTAAIPATPASQPGVTLTIPEGEEIEVVEADGTAPDGQRRVHRSGMLGLYVSEEDIRERTVLA
jgi:hypothetical protein